MATGSRAVCSSISSSLYMARQIVSGVGQSVSGRRSGGGIGQKLQNSIVNIQRSFNFQASARFRVRILMSYFLLGQRRWALVPLPYRECFKLGKRARCKWLMVGRLRAKKRFKFVSSCFKLRVEVAGGQSVGRRLLKRMSRPAIEGRPGQTYHGLQFKT